MILMMMMMMMMIYTIIITLQCKRFSCCCAVANRTYGVYNSPAACWRWLFQTWKFVRFSVVCNTLLIHSPDGTNVYGSRGGDFAGIWSVLGVERCVRVRALPIHLFRHFCCTMYRLATKHCVTDRQTDDIIMPIAEYNAVQSAKNIYRHYQ